MALKDQNPAALNQIQRIDWSVDWIEQLKGQVWGIIQNGGGGGGGTQNLQSVLSYGNSALFQFISLLANSNSQLTVSNTDNPSILLRSEDGTNGINFFVDDTFTQVIFFNQDIGTKLSLEPSGPILSNERVKIPVDTTFPLGDTGILLLSDFLGQPNGISTLDGSGLVPVSQLPYSAIAYQGTWDAQTNTPTLTDGSGTAGDFYFVSVAGTQNLGSGNITFDVGDIVIYSSTGVWQKVGTPIPTTQVVDSSSITDADYTLKLADNQKLLKAPFLTAHYINVPTDAVPFAPGSRVDIMMTESGQATFKPAVGVDIRSKGGALKTNGKYTVVSIEKIGPNEWVLVGDLTS